MSDIETIGSYVVHPAAAVFPLIEGDDFRPDWFKAKGIMEENRYGR